MNCPFCNEEPVCDYAIEHEVMTAALEEAEEVRIALNDEVNSLRIRVRQLESYILTEGLRHPTEKL